MAAADALAMCSGNIFFDSAVRRVCGRAELRFLQERAVLLYDTPEGSVVAKTTAATDKNTLQEGGKTV